MTRLAGGENNGWRPQQSYFSAPPKREAARQAGRRGQLRMGSDEVSPSVGFHCRPLLTFSRPTRRISAAKTALAGRGHNDGTDADARACIFGSSSVIVPDPLGRPIGLSRWLDPCRRTNTKGSGSRRAPPSKGGDPDALTAEDDVDEEEEGPFQPFPGRGREKRETICQYPSLPPPRRPLPRPPPHPREGRGGKKPSFLPRLRLGLFSSPSPESNCVEGH